jgi:hypothetical protein
MLGIGGMGYGHSGQRASHHEAVVPGSPYSLGGFAAAEGTVRVPIRSWENLPQAKNHGCRCSDSAR